MSCLRSATGPAYFPSTWVAFPIRSDPTGAGIAVSQPVATLPPWRAAADHGRGAGPALRAPSRRGSAPRLASHPVQRNATKPASAPALMSPKSLRSLPRQPSLRLCLRAPCEGTAGGQVPCCRTYGQRSIRSPRSSGSMPCVTDRPQGRDHWGISLATASGHPRAQ